MSKNTLWGMPVVTTSEVVPSGVAIAVDPTCDEWLGSMKRQVEQMVRDGRIVLIKDIGEVE